PRVAPRALPRRRGGGPRRRRGPGGRPRRAGEPVLGRARCDVRGPRRLRRRARPGALGRRRGVTDRAPDGRPTMPWPVAIREHAGPRAGLRALFELAADSPRALDATLDAGRVLAAYDGDRVVGHLQLSDAADAGA